MSSDVEKKHLKKYTESVLETIRGVEKKKDDPRSQLIAKRDFVIHQNDVHIEIKEGDDVSHVPERYWQNLKTENVI